MFLVSRCGAFLASRHTSLYLCRSNMARRESSPLGPPPGYQFSLAATIVRNKQKQEEEENEDGVKLSHSEAAPLPPGPPPPLAVPRHIFRASVTIQRLFTRRKARSHQQRHGVSSTNVIAAARPLKLSGKQQRSVHGSKGDDSSVAAPEPPYPPISPLRSVIRRTLPPGLPSSMGVSLDMLKAIRRMQRAQRLRMQNRKKAVAWWEKVAEKEDAYAQYNVGLRYEIGKGVEQSDSMAIQWYTKAADQGHAAAQAGIDAILTRHHVPRHLAAAVSLAEQGNPNNQYNLGLKYYEGQDVHRNNKKAIEWFEKAAERGHAKAEFALGIMHEYGQGVERNYKKAMEWWQKAAEQEDAHAQYNLGVMCYHGKGVDHDHKKAKGYYEKAAQQEHPNAQYGLGYMYYKGQGADKNFAKAAEWFEAAAKQGDSGAQFTLGIMYEEGEGVEQSDSISMKWYAKAAAQGVEAAQAGIDGILQKRRAAGMSDFPFHL